MTSEAGLVPSASQPPSWGLSFLKVRVGLAGRHLHKGSTARGPFGPLGILQAPILVWQLLSRRGAVVVFLDLEQADFAPEFNSGIGAQCGSGCLEMRGAPESPRERRLIGAHTNFGSGLVG